MRHFGGSLLLLAFSLILVAFAATEVVHRHELAKFEPPEGRTILLIGQAEEASAGYRRALGEPAGYMLYTRLTDLRGMTQAWRGSGCEDGGTQSLQDWAAHYPDSVAQIGLNITGLLPAICRGELDAEIRKLAAILRATGKPVFLRLGYEFDGPWNRYEPVSYVGAWRRMFDIFAGRKVGNQAITPVTSVAFVWHSAAWRTFERHQISSWYPGDDYVDWVGLSWFS